MARALASSLWGDAGSPAAGPGTGALDDYEILEEIGHGAMGVVYRARHRRLQRTVALKMIHNVVIKRPQALERFRIEAEAAASLHHPNIAPVYEAGEQDGRPFYTMRLVEGRSLAERISEFSLVVEGAGARGLRAEREKKLAHLMATIAGAVHCAH